MGLSDGGRIPMILSAVLIQYTRVTDGQTDELAWHIRAIAYAVARKKTRVTIGDVPADYEPARRWSSSREASIHDGK